MIKLTRRQALALQETNSRSHWLALSPAVRTVLDAIPTDQWPSVLSKYESKLLHSVARVSREREACVLARTRVLEMRKQRSKAGFGPLTKGFIIGCARAVGPVSAAAYFGFHSSQVSKWRQEESALSALEFLRLFHNTQKPTLDGGNVDEGGSDPKAEAVVAVKNETMPEPPDGFSKLKEAFARFAGKTKRRYSRSEKRAILELADNFGSKEVHERLGVSYDTIARLLRRAGRRPPEEVQEIPARYGLVVEIMKKHPGMGPMQIRDWLARHHGQRMGVNTVREVMERAGWVPPLVRRKEFRPGQFRRYEAVRRNVLWHGDFLHVFINSAKVYVLLIQDDHSRFIVGHGLFDGEKAEAVLAVVADAIARHGRPEGFMADRGSAFRSWRGIGQLTRYLEEIGIDQHIAVEARVNGKLENLNQQLQKELLDVRQFTSLAEFDAALREWVEHFNFRRCHQGLGKLQVPADRFYPGAMDGYAKAADKHRGEGEILRVLQEFVLATRGQSAAQVGFQ